MEKGKDLLSAERVLACSILADDTHMYLSGIVGSRYDVIPIPNWPCEYKTIDCSN